MKRKVQEVEAPEVVEVPTLDKTAIAEAATNHPALSKDEITLGGKKYKIVHLKYDDYILFLTLLAPLLEVAFSQMQLTTTPVNLDVLKVISMCGTNLPQLGQIVLSQTQSEITIEEVKALCPTPFKMAELVLLQVKHNEMIKDFGSFFPQLTEMMTP
jgi:hypothetical protein